MYGWIWRHLPGNTWAKSGCSLLLVVGVAALLWFVIFPWAEPLLPFDDGAVQGGGGHPVSTSGPAPSPTTSPEVPA
jgi:hypothetical protein